MFLIELKKTKIAKLIDISIRKLLRFIPPTSLSEALALIWGFNYRGAPKIVTLRSGTRMLVDPTDYLQNQIYYLGTFEENCLRLLRKILKPGDIFIDIGANIGIYTLEAAKVLDGTGLIYSFEPSTENFHSLENNVYLNKFENTKLYNIGIGSHNYQTKLFAPTGGNKGMYTTGNCEGELLEEISIISLDSFFVENNINSVSAIKLDIEGGEASALEGMTNILKIHHPAIFIELNSEALGRVKKTPADIIDYLSGLGYTGYIISKYGKKLVKIKKPYLYDVIEAYFVYSD